MGGDVGDVSVPVSGRRGCLQVSDGNDDLMGRSVGDVSVPVLEKRGRLQVSDGKVDVGERKE